jgi:UrcA family protein
MQRLMFALASALTLSLSLVVPAAADEAQPAETRQASYADADLSSQAGADAALDRIRRASRDECGIDEQRLLPISIYTYVRTCMREYTSNAVAQSGNAYLRTRYEERSAPAVVWR